MMRDVNPFKDSTGQVQIEVQCKDGIVIMRFIQGDDAFEVKLPEAEYAKLSYERIKPFHYAPKPDYQVQIQPKAQEPILLSRDLVNWDPTEAQ
jgi:hypothetical protein